MYIMATEMDKMRLKANNITNAEYYRNFYAYYRQPPETRLVIDRFIVEDSKKNPQEVMQMSFRVKPFGGRQQETNYNKEQQQEADAAAATAAAAAAAVTAATAAATASQGDQSFSAIHPSGGKRKSKKYRYKKPKNSKTNKRRRSRSKSNKRSRK